jgi:hypothetical protein
MRRYDFGNFVRFPVAGADGTLAVSQSDAVRRKSPEHLMWPRYWHPLWLCFALAPGLTHDPPTMMEGVHAERVFCAALSLASAGALMVLLDVWHPPAGATTLIIALGIITRPYHLLIVEAAVVMLVLQALVINRLAGFEYPVWAPADRVLQEAVVTSGSG